MKKKISALLLTAFMLIGTGLPVFAEGISNTPLTLPIEETPQGETIPLTPLVPANENAITPPTPMLRTPVTGDGFTFDSSLGKLTITSDTGMTAWKDDANITKYNVKTVGIENGVTSIKAFAFSGCDELTSVTIPNSVTLISDGAFSGCTSFASISVSTENTNYSAVDGVLFNKNKTNLILYPISKSGTTYAIPDSVTSIRDRAFLECAKLTSVTIPNSVTEIGLQTFNGCDSLTSFSVGADNLGYSADNGILFNKNKTELIRYPLAKAETTYAIPNSVTSIDNEAFMDCIGLTTISIPKSVGTINWGAFNGCTGLTDVNLDQDTNLTKIGGYAFANCTNLETFDIPDGVTFIGMYAFERCSSLSEIDIPDGVTAIGQETFSRCTSLVNFDIPNSVTKIYLDAFNTCSALTSVTIGNSVTEIGEGAFEKCTALDDITFSGSIPTFGSNVFQYIPATGGEVRVPVGSDIPSWKSALAAAGLPTEWTVVFDAVFAVPPTISGDLSTTEKIYDFNESADSLSITATGTGTGSVLSYQWYSNDENNTTTPTTVGTNTNTYTPLTRTAGTTYYYCVVTNTITDNGDGGTKFATTTSNIANIKVNEQTFTIGGTIKGSDSTSGIGATLQLKDGPSNFGSAVTANGSGVYTIPNVPAGTYTIEVSCSGYDSATISGVTVSTGNIAGKDLTLDKTTNFKEVTDIAMSNATSIEANADLTLTGEVTPADSTNRSIVWSVSDQNGTGASVTGSTFKATTAGTATVTATVTNGLTASSDYTKIFDITVTPASDPTPPPVVDPTPPVVIPNPPPIGGGGYWGGSYDSSIDDVTETTKNGVTTFIITQNKLKELINKNNGLTLSTDYVEMKFDTKSLKKIGEKIKSDVYVTVKLSNNNGLSASAQNIVGNRPICDINVKNSSGTYVTDFGTGWVSVSISYLLQANEKSENIVGVHIDSNGNAALLEHSSYDKNKGEMTFLTNHFSTFAVGYNAPQVTHYDVTPPISTEVPQTGDNGSIYVAGLCILLAGVVLVNRKKRI